MAISSNGNLVRWELRKELKRYEMPPEAFEAKLEVKRCVDQMSYGDRYGISETLANVSLHCDLQECPEMFLPIFQLF